jgi:hypothetical protein
VFLSEDTYQKHYCSLDWPRRAQRDTKYCILFRACAGFMLDAALRTERWVQSKSCASCWKMVTSTRETSKGPTIL